jgi:hypothetical protein
MTLAHQPLDLAPLKSLLQQAPTVFCGSTSIAVQLLADLAAETGSIRGLLSFDGSKKGTQLNGIPYLTIEELPSAAPEQIIVCFSEPFILDKVRNVLLNSIGDSIYLHCFTSRAEDAQYEQAYAEIAALFPDVSRSEVDFAIQRFLYARNNMVGRSAGRIANYVVQYFMRKKAAALPSAGAHLEIGVLFGLGSLMSISGLVAAGSTETLHMVDPLSGFYGEENDPLTRTEISPQNAVKNIVRFAGTDRHHHIHAQLSNDPSLLAELKNIKWKSAYIDGDHTYQGIKDDWLNFSGNTVVGGYVLIDNYHDHYWPEVSDYVDNEMLPQIAEDWAVIRVSDEACYILLQRLR